MFIIDKNNNLINVDQVMGFFVDTNPDGGYEVKANSADGVLEAQFVIDAPMSEPDAQALLARIGGIVGTLDLSA